MKSQSSFPQLRGEKAEQDPTWQTSLTQNSLLPASCNRVRRSPEDCTHAKFPLLRAFMQLQSEKNQGARAIQVCIACFGTCSATRSRASASDTSSGPSPGLEIITAIDPSGF